MSTRIFSQPPSQQPKVVRVNALCLAIALFAFMPNTWADDHTDVHNISTCAPDNIALTGYDAVSYRQDGGPVKGNKQYAKEVGGLTYIFSSQENLETFETNPSHFIPSYLGWCSTNLSMGRLACPDYSNFKIENDKLLLFEHAGFTNGRDVWNADPKTHKRQADTNFKKFSKQT